MCLIGIVGTSLANIPKVVLPKEREISMKKFVKGNPFKNEVTVHMRTPKFFEA